MALLLQTLYKRANVPLDASLEGELVGEVKAIMKRLSGAATVSFPDFIRMLGMAPFRTLLPRGLLEGLPLLASAKIGQEGLKGLKVPQGRGPECQGPSPYCWTAGPPSWGPGRLVQQLSL